MSTLGLLFQFSEAALYKLRSCWSSTKRTSSSFHRKVACFCHHIVDKLFTYPETTITHSPLSSNFCCIHYVHKYTYSRRLKVSTGSLLIATLISKVHGRGRTIMSFEALLTNCCVSGDYSRLSFSI